MRYSILYGKKSLNLEIPKKRVVGVLAPREAEQIPDIGAAVQASLCRPCESESLAAQVRGKKSALIITVDNTRPSPEAMLLPILDVCEGKGLEVSIIIATGRHRQMTEGELHAHLGERTMKTCRILQHDPFDTGNMAHRGITKLGSQLFCHRFTCPCAG